MCVWDILSWKVTARSGRAGVSRERDRENEQGPAPAPGFATGRRGGVRSSDFIAGGGRVKAKVGRVRTGGGRSEGGPTASAGKGQEVDDSAMTGMKPVVGCERLPGGIMVDNRWVVGQGYGPLMGT